LEVFKYLWELSEVDVMALTDAGETFFHLAAQNGKTDVVQFVCERMVHQDKNRAVLTSKCHKQQTALHRAAANGQ
jgi:hypothetical protein